MADLIIRRIETREEVKRITLAQTNERYVEKALRGLLTNMDTDRFFVDTSEVDDEKKA